MNRVVRFVLAALALPLAVCPALAGIPEDRTVTYTLRADPASATSDVEFLIELDLVANAEDGNTVGWLVAHARFSETSSNGEPVRSWSIVEPYVDTGDGLWWIAHDDWAEPRVDEFDDPPGLIGTAAAEDPLDDDLDYDFAGATLDSQHASMYGGSVAGLTHAFQVVGESQPVEEGEAEPAELGGAVNPNS